MAQMGTIFNCSRQNSVHRNVYRVINIMSAILYTDVMLEYLVGTDKVVYKITCHEEVAILAKS